MVQSYRRKSLNTAEARKKRRPLLRFAFGKGRPTGMPVLGLIYPCRFLAEHFDPQSYHRNASRTEQLPTLSDLRDQAEEGIRAVVTEALVAARGKPGPVDEAWYWAAPIMLDQRHYPEDIKRWFSNPILLKSGMADRRRTIAMRPAIGPGMSQPLKSFSRDGSSWASAR